MQQDQEIHTHKHGRTHTNTYTPTLSGGRDFYDYLEIPNTFLSFWRIGQLFLFLPTVLLIYTHSSIVGICVCVYTHMHVCVFFILFLTFVSFIGCRGHPQNYSYRQRVNLDNQGKQLQNLGEQIFFSLHVFPAKQRFIAQFFSSVCGNGLRCVFFLSSWKEKCIFVSSLKCWVCVCVFVCVCYCCYWFRRM